MIDDPRFETLVRDYLFDSYGPEWLERHAPGLAVMLQSTLEDDVRAIEHDEQLRAEQEEQRGSKCSEACGFCGACS